MPQALDGVRSGGCCRACAAAIIRGKSRMSSTLTYGSVRGVPGDRHPYRDHRGKSQSHGALVARSGRRIRHEEFHDREHD